MTAPPGAGAGTALIRCVGDADRFLADAWNRRAHLHAGGDVADLLAVDAVDELLSSTALRAPAFRLVKAGATLPASACTRRARIGSKTVTDLIDVEAVYREFNDGATIVLQGLHRFRPDVAAFCRDLEATLTHPVQANAYITPPVAQGLRVHADAHDVFALQTHGSKQWVVYEDDDPHADPTLDTSLRAGDCLYVPKGTRHAARTEDTHSIHLTLGVKTTTWADLLLRAVDGVLDDPSFAGALPAGYASDPAGLAPEVSERMSALVAALGDVDGGGLAESAADRFWSGRQPALRGQLTRMLAVDELDDTTVVRRAGGPLRVTTDGDQVSLSLDDRGVALPAAAEPVLRWISERETFAVGDLTGRIDDSSRLLLVKRLVREGLLLLDG